MLGTSIWWLALLGASSLAVQHSEPAIDLPQVARIAIVGDGLAVGMEETGYFELMLRGAFAGHQLDVRHFGVRGATVREPWPGPGSSRAEHALTDFAPQLVVYCLGRNDIAAGEGGLASLEEAFSKRLRTGKRGRTLVLAPIVFPESPLWQERDRYAGVMRRVCERERVVFLDLAQRLSELRVEASEPLTWNGVDLNPYGQWLLALLTARELGWAGAEGTGTWADWEKARAAVVAKNRRWRERWLSGKPAPGGDDDEAKIRKLAVLPLGALWSVEPRPHQELKLKLPENPVSQGIGSSAALPAMALAPGYSVRMWARAEELPFGGARAMDFDAEGRLYLLCSAGRVIRLEDQDRNHVADRHDVFAELPGEPSGLAVRPGGLWLALDGELGRLGDRDGDGRAEVWDPVLSRFEVSGPVAGIRNLTCGLTGELWFTVEQSRAARLETTRGILDAPPGCALYRFIPDRGDLIRVADWKLGGEALLCFDSREGLAVTAPSNGATYLLDQLAWFAGKPAGAPVIQTGSKVGAAVCWRSPVPPERMMQDRLIFAEAGAKGGLRWMQETRGALPGWVESSPLYLIRPVPGFFPAALIVGPDGALYVLDRAGGKAGEERIWRVASKWSSEHWEPPTEGRTALELLNELRDEPPQLRNRVRQELWQMPEAEVNEALEGRQEETPPEKALPKPEPCDVLQVRVARGWVDEAVLGQVVESGTSRGRVAASLACGEWYPRLQRGEDWLRKLLDDEVAEVRLAALGTARRLGGAAMGELVRLAGAHPRPGVLEPVYQATLHTVGAGSGASVASLRAQAEALATDALSTGELTPAKAAALWGRAGVAPVVLQRAAALLATRRGLSFSEYLFRLVEDKWTPEQELRNVQLLLVNADSRELHQAVSRLRDVAKAAPAGAEAKRAARSGLVLASAASRVLSRLIQEAEAAGDQEVTDLLDSAVAVAAHPSARPYLKEWVRRELEMEDREELTVAAQTRRQMAIALATALGEPQDSEGQRRASRDFSD